MIRDLIEILKEMGRSFFRITMQHYGKLKPFLFWISPTTRSRFKTSILRIAFKLFYSMKPEVLYDKDFKQGVNLIGYPFADIGDGEFIRQTARSFTKSNIEFGIYDCGFETKVSQNYQHMASLIRPSNSYLVNIFHLKPDNIEAFIIRHGESLIAGHFNIGYWAWELGMYPDAWKRSLKYFNEVWCPSRFIQSAVSKCSSQSIFYMPPAFDIKKPKEFDRNYFNLSDGRFLFLFVFDFKSFISRKNPSGCIQAFQKGFPQGNEDVGLVLKSIGGKQYSEEFKSLKMAAQSDRRITVIDAMFTYDEIIGLMNVCDVFMSLHRSEGVGHSIAESMMLGKPVIATNYSGNTDFTRPDNSCLVDYKLIELKKGEYPYSKGQVWADPNLDQAASYMRRLVEDDSYRNTIAKAGLSYIKTNHNSEAVGKNYSNRLIELGLINN